MAAFFVYAWNTLRRTKEEAEVTRQRILDAALAVFSQRGYAATRLADIAAAARVTRGAIYWHFASKADLYTTLMQERMTDVFIGWQPAAAATSTPLTVLRELLIRPLEYLEEDATYRSLVELNWFKTEVVPELEAGFRDKVQHTKEFIEFVGSLVRAGIAAGEIRPDVDPHIAAVGAVGLVSGLTSLAVMNMDTTPDPALFAPKQQAAAVVDRFLLGIAVQD